MFNRYKSKDSWLVKLLAGAAFGACAFFYLLEGSFLENLGYTALSKFTGAQDAQRAAIVCSDYMKARGACTEDSPSQAAPDTTESFNSLTKTDAGMVTEAGNDPIVYDMPSESGSDVSVDIVNNDDGSYKWEEVKILDVSQREMGRDITEVIGDNSTVVSYINGKGETVKVGIIFNEETNTATVVRDANGEVTPVSVNVEETDKGLTVTVASVDKEGVEVAKAIEVQPNDDNSVSFYVVNDDGSRSLVKTVSQKELFPELYDAYPERSALEVVVDTISEAVTAVVDAVTEVATAVGEFLGLVTPTEFNEDGYTGKTPVDTNAIDVVNTNEVNGVGSEAGIVEEAGSGEGAGIDDTSILVSDFNESDTETSWFSNLWDTSSDFGGDSGGGGSGGGWWNSLQSIFSD